MPAVLGGRPWPAPAACVDVDNLGGARQAVEHLVEAVAAGSPPSPARRTWSPAWSAAGYRDGWPGPAWAPTIAGRVGRLQPGRRHGGRAALLAAGRTWTRSSPPPT